MGRRGEGGCEGVRGGGKREGVERREGVRVWGVRE